MFKNKFVLGIIVAGMALIGFYLFSSAPTYAERAEKTREAYKTTMVTMKDSPVKLKSGFRFFEADEAWVIEADFQRAEGDRTFRVQMTDSTVESSKLAGTVRFIHAGKPVELLVFDEGANFLLPFKDGSNGQETYGGGRYLNIDKGELVGKKITLDFNNSHNFYCAYEASFVCPVPPRENHLPFAVNAGELLYQK
jgi:uncharacterized protein (DUF1684 family)